jgi:lysozyme
MNPVQNNNNDQDNSYKTQVLNKTVFILKPFEKYMQYVYSDVAGIDTVGYGHVVLSGEDYSAGLTESEASYLLYLDVETRYNQIVDFIEYELSVNQMAAVLSLVFNIGVTAFKNSTLLKRLNEADFESAADQFLVWNKARVNGTLTIVRGLTNRRIAEKEIFES